ncbi:hypothetical protein [Kibdelosporangium philippinense]|uniref:hypothetical protein n=1 Tax=Kibdelosporangium philippinense TaxID=211113 RepID=UPI003609436C
MDPDRVCPAACRSIVRSWTGPTSGHQPGPPDSARLPGGIRRPRRLPLVEGLWMLMLPRLLGIHVMWLEEGVLRVRQGGVLCVTASRSVPSDRVIRAHPHNRRSIRRRV